MSGWIGYVTVVCVIVLIWLTQRIHAEAMFSGNDLWGRLLGGDHSAHHHSSHSDGSHGSGSADSGGGADGGGGGDGGSGF